MKPTVPEPAPAREVSQIVEHLFRQESGKMVAVLTRIFGLEHFQLAEDVVQEALSRALQSWPFYGMPENPSAWLMRTARNLALDVVRRQSRFREKEPEIVRLMDRGGAGTEEVVFSDQEIADDRLRLLFVCCHPAIPAEAHVALALKTLCGFGITEIARAFLTTDAAIAKRLTRAKQKIREENIAFEIPAGAELARRLEGVLQSLYLLFNEGYKASVGDQLIREDLCQEAIRLITLLTEHAAGNQPKAHALLALMLLNAGRSRARVDGDGQLVRLRDQDRSQWDRALIARGMFHLARSAAGAELSEYHLQAGIAACHCAASDYASTDWAKILALYDGLVAMDPSPVVALNRAVALAQIQGPEAAVAAVKAIPNCSALESYHLFHAALGEWEWQLQHWPAAAAHLRRALELTEQPAERTFLTQRLQACEEGKIFAEEMS